MSKTTIYLKNKTIIECNNNELSYNFKSEPTIVKVKTDLEWIIIPLTSITKISIEKDKASNFNES